MADGGGAGAGLLDAGFEKVGGLEEEGGCAAGAEAGEEVEAWREEDVRSCLWYASIGAAGGVVRMQ